MAERAVKKQKLTDEEVVEFIKGIEERQVTSDKDSFLRDDVLSMSYTVGGFIDAVDRVLKCPSAAKVAMFKNASLDRELVQSLDDPYVALALALKKAYDEGKIPLFDTLLDFKARNPVEFQPDNVLEKFSRQAAFFLPDLPDIKNEELKDRIHTNRVSDDLVQLGRGRFQKTVCDLLVIRFPDQNVISKITKYLFGRRVARTWALLFHLPVDDKSEPSALFYACLGAILLSNVTYSDEEYFKTFVAILIEPIVLAFDETKPLDFARTELEKKEAKITYSTVHSTVYDNNEFHLVHVIAGEGRASVLLGFGTASTEEDAQAKAAANATHRESQLNRLLNQVKELEDYYGQSGSTIRQDGEEEYDTHQHQHLPQHQQQQQQQPVYGQPVYGHTPPQPIHISPAPIHSATHNGNLDGGLDPGTAMTHPPNSLINEEYQRQKQYDNESVILVPNVEDEAAIDKSSKEKLNHKLIENRYAPAEYKTSKISNSDVQVVCFIENIPMSRAISTNKKKAGQLCAQFILNYSDYFFGKLPARN